MGGVRVLGSGVHYSDGSEDALISIMRASRDRSAGSDELAAQASDWPTEYHLSPSRQNLLGPLRLEPGLRILDVGCGTGALTRAIAEAGCDVIGLEGSYSRAEAAAARLAGVANAQILCGSLDDFVTSPPADVPTDFDVIMLCGVLEYSGAKAGGAHGPHRMLQAIHGLLRPDGALAVAIENRWGLKYVLGYPEDHLGRPWIGMEGYWRDQSGVNTWSERELRALLAAEGFASQYWFGAFPDYKTPSQLIGEELFASEDGMRIIKQLVRKPVTSKAGAPTLNADPIPTFHAALDAGFGLGMANSFLVVCGKQDAYAKHRASASAWVFSSDRLRDFRTARALRPAPDGWTLDLESGGARVELGLLRYHQASRALVVGTNAEDPIAAHLAAHGIESQPLLEHLSQWWAEASSVMKRPPPQGYQFDVLPRNFIIDGQGRWHFVDTEFAWDEAWPEPIVALRSLYYTLHELVVGPSLIKGVAASATVLDVALGLCRRLGIPASESTWTQFLELECQLQAAVSARTGREDFREKWIHGMRQEGAKSFSDLSWKASVPTLLARSHDAEMIEHDRDRLAERERELEAELRRVRAIASDRDRLAARERELEGALEQAAAAEAHPTAVVDDLERQRASLEAVLEETRAHQHASDERAEAFYGQYLKTVNSRRWRYSGYLRSPQVVVRRLVRPRNGTAFSADLAQDRLAIALFDEEFYLRTYPSTKKSSRRPWKHFITEGIYAGLNPNPLFDASWYLGRNPDVSQSLIPAFAHFVNNGVREGRPPSAAWIVNPDLAALLARASEAADPNAAFLAAWNDIYWDKGVRGGG